MMIIIIYKFEYKGDLVRLSHLVNANGIFFSVG